MVKSKEQITLSVWEETFESDTTGHLHWTRLSLTEMSVNINYVKLDADWLCLVQWQAKRKKNCTNKAIDKIINNNMVDRLIEIEIDNWNS